MPKNLPILIIIVLLGACAGDQINQSSSTGRQILAEYENIGLTPGPTAKDINVNWLSNTARNSVSLVRIFGENEELLMTAEGTVSTAFSGNKIHRVTIEGLLPNTQYSYSVSSDGYSWSTKYSFRTARTDRFRFAAVGDPQLGSGNMAPNSNWFSSDRTSAQAWKNTMTRIAAANVNFVVGMTGEIQQYQKFLAPSELRNIPFAPAIGNYDRQNLVLHHHNLPNEQGMDRTGNYWYVYNNALFVVLNSSAYPGSVEAAKLHIDQFDSTLAAAITANRGDYTWLFVKHHKSSTVLARHAMPSALFYYVEAGFEELMDKYNVDFVLSSHYHIYNRSFAIRGGRIVNNSRERIRNPRGTIYLTLNTTGGLQYDNSPSPENLSPYTFINIQTRKPEFTIIEVENRTVQFRTYSIDSTIPIDMFTVEKS